MLFIILLLEQKNFKIKINSSRKKLIYNVLFYLIILSFTPIFSQSTLPYHWPVKGKEVITGSFGEFRKYNFHMGTDFATEGKEGIPVLALTKGKVVKLQSLRYSIGNAVWLEHEDGFTSRYGHLQRFSDVILNSIGDENILKKIQFREDFEYTLPIDKQIKLERGEILGYSGKTGIGPPHLHVDLLLENTSYNLSDFLDLKSLDTKLVLDYVELIPINEKSFINGKNQVLKLEFINSENEYFIPKKNEVILIQGEVGVKLAAYEKSSGGNRLGLRYIALRVNDILYQEIDMRRIYQPHTIQSCFVFDNYASRVNGKPFKYFLFSRGNTDLENLRFKSKGNGLLYSSRLEKEITSLIQLELKGINSKKLIASFRVKPDEQTYPITSNLYPVNNVLVGEEKTFFSEDKNVEISFKKDSLFVDNFFSVIKNNSIQIKNSEFVLLSDVYSIYPDYRDFNKGFELSFNYNSSLNLYPEKLGLYLVNSEGEIIKLISNKPKESGLFKVNLRQTGHFVVLEDHSPPKVWVHKWKSGQTLNPENQIFIKASDLGSGFTPEGLVGTLDGEKAYFDYDPDLNQWELFYPESFRTSGNHILEITVTDRSGNSSNKIIFEYKIR